MVLDYTKIQVNRNVRIVIGTVVWVLLDGFPWWPAYVVNREEREPTVELDENEQLAPESDLNRMVEFFNDDGRVAVVELSNMCEYVSNMHLVRQSGKPRKDVISACREANNYIEERGIREQFQRYCKAESFDDYIKPRKVGKHVKKGPASSAGASMDGHLADNGRDDRVAKRKAKVKRKTEIPRTRNEIEPDSPPPPRRHSDIPRKPRTRDEKVEPNLVNSDKEGRTSKNAQRRGRDHFNGESRTRKQTQNSSDRNEPPSRKHGTGQASNSRLESSQTQSLSRSRYDTDNGQSATQNRGVEQKKEIRSQPRRHTSESGSQSRKIRRDTNRIPRKRESEGRDDSDIDTMTEKPPRKRPKTKNKRMSEVGERRMTKHKSDVEMIPVKRDSDHARCRRSMSSLDSDSDESPPPRSIAKNRKNIAAERRRREEDSDDEEEEEEKLEFDVEPVDRALASNKTKTEDVVGEFDMDVVDRSEAKPSSARPSPKELGEQFENFQVALVKYHDELLEAAYLRNLLSTRMELARDKRNTLLTEIRKLKEVAVSPETLVDTGVMKKLVSFVKAMKERAPGLVEDMNSLAKRWSETAGTHVENVGTDFSHSDDNKSSSSKSKVEDNSPKFRSKQVGKVEDNSPKFRSKPVGKVEDNSPKFKSKQVRKVEDNSPKFRSKQLKMVDNKKEVGGNAVQGATGPSPPKKTGFRSKRINSVERRLDDGEVGTRKARSSSSRGSSEGRASLGSDKRSEGAEVPKTEGVTATAADSVKNIRIAERAKQLDPEMNKKALRLIIGGSGYADEEVMKMTELVEREIRRRSEEDDSNSYYVNSVRVIKVLKRKSTCKEDIDKLWRTQKADHLFD